MDPIAVYTITSGLHDEAAVKNLSDEFLSGIFPEGGYGFFGADFSSFGSAPLNLIYIRTGGAEGIFRDLLPGLLDKGIQRFYLLTSGKSNSLAASLEILSYLRQKQLEGEVLHGSIAYLRKRIGILSRVEAAREQLQGMSVGVVGHPSDWLISSTYNKDILLRKLGIRISDIPMEELLDRFEKERTSPVTDSVDASPEVQAAFPNAARIYLALHKLVDDYGLGALTLRCFDLLSSVRNTGCYALSRLNSEGIPSSCEGDVPALLSMMIAKALTGCTGFQANPARIDVETGEILFAHCTIPFGMVDSFCYDSHFESGIGVGIHGHFPEGPVTVFKVSGTLGRVFIAEGDLLRNQYEDNLCRTQVWLKLRPEDARYFLSDPIGNHHIILPGHHRGLLEEMVGRP